ncbi:MAG TPA: MarR family transcriptional regulator [Planctomycetaceae bacterium]|nr:MarR family transcriptional regulator [Planctomycetaceae bacterium]
MSAGELQREIRKKKPFDLPEEEAGLNLVRTVDFLQLPFERLFAEHGLSDSQYNVLRILRGHGGEGLPCTEIGSQMLTRMPDITRLVDRLEQSKLVERARTAADRRVVMVRLTKAGREVLDRLDAPVRALHKQALGHLTRAELAELTRLLVKVRQARTE